MKFLKKKILKFYLSLLKFFTSNDVLICKVEYLIKNGTKLNLEKPNDFSEKISWLKLFHYGEEFSNIADKFESRKYVEKKVGNDILINAFGIYDSVNDIDIESFPNEFVLKGTHGSGYNLIVKDKSKLNWKKERKRFNKWLQENYYYKYREKVYKNIKPRIIAEKYLSELEDNNMIDYKFYCFHGQPKYILVKTMEDNVLKKCYYDLDWNKITPEKDSDKHLKKEIEKPKCFEEMITIAQKLSTEFIFIRVDLYEIKNKIYFGELTFFPTGGMHRIYIEELNEKMGKLIKLPF